MKRLGFLDKVVENLAAAGMETQLFDRFHRGRLPDRRGQSHVGLLRISKHNV
jgi:hypothetical protein